MMEFLANNWTDLVSAVLGLTTVFLAGRGKVSNFWVGYVYSAFLFLLFWSLHLYASMGIQLVAVCINVYGHYHWTHPDDSRASTDGTLAVSSLTFREWILYIAVLFFVLGMIYSLLVRTDDPQPVLDAICTSLILMAQLLSAQKKTECWIVWLVVNVTNLVLYLKAGLVFMPFVAGLYLANGVWSLISWKKDERNS